MRARWPRKYRTHRVGDRRPQSVVLRLTPIKARLTRDRLRGPRRGPREEARWGYCNRFRGWGGGRRVIEAGGGRSGIRADRAAHHRQGLVLFVLKSPLP